MNQNRVIFISMTALLFLSVSCTATTQAPETVATVVITPSPTAVPTEETGEEATTDVGLSATPAPTEQAGLDPTGEATTASHGGKIGGYVELVDALRAAGATVSPAGEVEQPFFSVRGQVIAVNGEDVQVFEYQDADTASAEAGTISPDASSVGTAMMTWIATPHFYARDRLIVLYVGDDQQVISTMNEVLGPPVAERQTAGQPPADEERAAYPADTRTGMAELDAIIDAVLGHDAEALRSLTQYTVVGCTHADGLGGPPKCEADEAEGSLIEVVPFLGPEGHHLRRADYEMSPGPDVRGLLAAYRVAANAYTDAAYPVGEFALVFLGPNDLVSVTLQVTGGRVIRFDFNFGNSLEDDLERDAAEMILPLYGTQALPQSATKVAVVLEEALATGDYDALESLMGDPFAIGYWRSEGQMLSPAQAVEELRLNLLPNPAGVSFIRDQEQFPDLDGIEPAAVFGPDAQIVDLVYSQGWGLDGQGEAILTLGEHGDGRQYWQGIIYSFAGFG